jgi:hypothetical protein
MNTPTTLLAAGEYYKTLEQIPATTFTNPQNNPNGWSILTEAVHNQQLAMVMAICEFDKSMIRTREPCGATALHRAAQLNDPDYVQVLIDHGADVNAQDIDGDCPLHWASACGSPSSVLKRLLKYGADTTIVNRENKTAIQVATAMQTKAFWFELTI